MFSGTRYCRLCLATFLTIMIENSEITKSNFNEICSKIGRFGHKKDTRRRALYAPFTSAFMVDPAGIEPTIFP